MSISIDNIESYMNSIKIDTLLSLDTMVDRIILYHNKGIINDWDFIHLIKTMRNTPSTVHKKILEYEKI